MSKVRGAHRVGAFPDSVFGEMTRLAQLHNAVNLSQGFPDFPAPLELKEAARRSIDADHNQYAPGCGVPALRNGIGRMFTERTGVPILADDQVTVCCGSTEAMFAAIMAAVDPGDEHIVYDDLEHVSIASLPGMADRTVTVSGMSKTFSVTGWRIGWAIAPAAIASGIRKLHDFLTVAAPTPLQEASAAALSLPQGFYDSMQADYQRRRDYLLASLQRHGFRCCTPHGAYYIMADVTACGFTDDFEFARYLVSEFQVATIPGSSFYDDPKSAPPMVRFCFSKKDETLAEADECLARFASRTTHRKR